MGNYLTGRFTIRFGTKKMMIWGCLIALIGPLMQFCTLSLFNLGALGLFGPMFFVGLGQGLTLPNAAAGIVSVNPKLAGTASGLGSTIQISIGGMLAFLTGYFISISNSPLQLVTIFFICLVVSLIFTFLIRIDD